MLWQIQDTSFSQFSSIWCGYCCAGDVFYNEQNWLHLFSLLIFLLLIFFLPPGPNGGKSSSRLPRKHSVFPSCRSFTQTFTFTFCLIFSEGREAGKHSFLPWGWSFNLMVVSSDLDVPENYLGDDNTFNTVYFHPSFCGCWCKIIYFFTSYLFWLLVPQCSQWRRVVYQKRPVLRS